MPIVKRTRRKPISKGVKKPTGRKLPHGVLITSRSVGPIPAKQKPLKKLVPLKKKKIVTLKKKKTKK